MHLVPGFQVEQGAFFLGQADTSAKWHFSGAEKLSA
jgi:hypothetical protein